MATVAPPFATRRLSADSRFFVGAALAMTAITVGGFANQFLQGRSTFAVPLLYHLHAAAFMGWVAIYLAQTVFATIGPMRLHRTLGWIAAAWVVPMLILGPALTIDRVRAGRVPFFFEPQHFLIANPMSMIVFVGLTVAAIVQRRRSDWHRRLHLCGMTALLGPGVGRLLPLPLMQPLAFQISMAVPLVFPVAGVIVDLRRGRGVHPAWLWGIGAIVAAMPVIELVARGAIGDAVYRAVTADTPGAAVAPMAFKPPPSGP